MSAQAQAADFDDDVLLREVTADRPTQDELIAQSKQIRQECEDLVGRYEAAVRARRKPHLRPAPESAAPTPVRAQASDAAFRKKALRLLVTLMSEELL